MPPPINPGDHVPSEEVLDSYLHPFAVKIKPFKIPISMRHLAIFEGRPVAPNELPFSKGMIWQCHEVPKLGIHYEYGLHLSPRVVPIDKFLSDRKWRKYRKRHYPLYLQPLTYSLPASEPYTEAVGPGYSDIAIYNTSEMYHFFLPTHTCMKSTLRVTLPPLTWSIVTLCGW